MQFADGAHLETDMIVILRRHPSARRTGARLRPRRSAPRGGIAIDGDCRTSRRIIYAIGECASWNGRIFGLVAPGYQMARIAAARMLGQHGEASPAPT